MVFFIVFPPLAKKGSANDAASRDRVSRYDGCEQHQPELQHQPSGRFDTGVLICVLRLSNSASVMPPFVALSRLGSCGFGLMTWPSIVVLLPAGCSEEAARPLDGS
jgi:hypothetical protein